MLSFGDYKKNEIAELIRNKDPLGLNTDINMSINNSYSYKWLRYSDRELYDH